MTRFAVAFTLFVAVACAIQTLPGVVCPTSLGSCTANDVQTTVISSSLVNGVCTTATDLITLDVTVNYTSTAATRYDLGLYVSDTVGGFLNQAPFATSCLGRAALVGDGNPPALFLDENPQDGANICGDLTSTEGAVSWTLRMTVPCNIQEDGSLRLESCRFWYQSGNSRPCTGLTDDTTGSKCDCTPLILIDVPAPCFNGGNCNDNDPCTTDTCTVVNNAAVCQHTPTNLAVNIATSPVLCNGGSTGSATATATGGSGSYTYAWNGGGTSATKTGLADGPVSITVTDSAGCVRTDADIVTEPTALVVSVTGANVVCNGGVTTVSASASGGVGPYRYAWSTGATTASIVNVNAGSYSVTAWDANNCQTTGSKNITQPSVVVAQIGSVVNVLCRGGSTGSALASGSGGAGPTYKFAWSNGGTAAMQSGLSAGTYSVTAFDVSMCPSTGVSVNITQPATSVTVVATSTPTSCVDGSATGSVTAVGAGGVSPYTYMWSNGGTGATRNNLGVGLYIVTITDNNGCKDTDSVTVSANTAIQVTTSRNQPVSCFGGSNGEVTFVASGGVPAYRYQWNDGFTSMGATSARTGLAAGTWSVTVTDSATSGSCVATRSAFVQQPTQLVVSATRVNPLCGSSPNTGSLSSSASGGMGSYTYLWTGGSTNSGATGVPPGTYRVTVTDGNQCTAVSNQVTIVAPATLTVGVSVVNATCNGGNSGSATATANGGTGGYTYSWSNEGTTSTISNLVAGFYQVVVSDANGCTAAGSNNVGQPTALQATATSTPTNCNDNIRGTASVSVVQGSGTPGYRYLWSTGSTNSVISNLSAGSYSVSVWDANNCQIVRSTTVGVISTFSLSSSSTQSTCPNNDGTATVFVTGNVQGTLTYAWSSGAVTQTATGLAGNITYTVTVSDGICTSTRQQLVTQFCIPRIPITLQLASATTTCACCRDGTATATAIGGLAPFTFTWAPAGGFQANPNTNPNTYTGLNGGMMYRVTVTDSQNPPEVSVSQVFVSSGPSIFVSVFANPDTSCEVPYNGSVTTSVGNAAPGAIRYVWSNGATTPSISGLSAGTYGVTVTDSQNCVASNSGLVREDCPCIEFHGICQPDAGKDCCPGLFCARHAHLPECCPDGCCETYKCVRRSDVPFIDGLPFKK